MIRQDWRAPAWRSLGKTIEQGVKDGDIAAWTALLSEIANRGALRMSAVSAWHRGQPEQSAPQA